SSLARFLWAAHEDELLATQKSSPTRSPGAGGARGGCMCYYTVGRDGDLFDCGCRRLPAPRRTGNRTSTNPDGHEAACPANSRRLSATPVRCDPMTDSLA